ncbi:MAG: hypothetical protein ACO1RT_14965 [Planctomycetaceae bacterium]
MNRFQISLRSAMIGMLFCSLGIGYVMNYRRMRAAEAELQQLRREVGYLEPSGDDELAAVRVVVDEPLIWQAKIRVPATPRYRVAYSTLWHETKDRPDWFGAQPLPQGESVVTVRVLKDPRDDQWKISTIVRHPDGVRRMGTVLPEEISAVLRGSHDVISGGIGKQTVVLPAGQKVRLFDERYFSGTALLLYGDRAPETDMVGIFAELQPDVGTL